MLCGVTLKVAGWHGRDWTMISHNIALCATVRGRGFLTPCESLTWSTYFLALNSPHYLVPGHALVHSATFPSGLAIPAGAEANGIYSHCSVGSGYSSWGSHTEDGRAVYPRKSCCLCREPGSQECLVSVRLEWEIWTILVLLALQKRGEIKQGNLSGETGKAAVWLSEVPTLEKRPGGSSFLTRGGQGPETRTNRIGRPFAKPPGEVLGRLWALSSWASVTYTHAWTAESWEEEGAAQTGTSCLQRCAA